VIVGTRLFVTDVTSVLGYNLSNGASVMNLAITGSSFLNDIESNGSNYLYVSDMNTHKIFRIDITSISSPTYTTFVSSGITSPNGLLYDAANSRLLLVSYRSNSPVEAVDISSGSVSTIITTSLSNLDGITRDDTGNIYFSSWGTNAVYKCNSTFTTGPNVFQSGYSGPADIYYNTASKVLVVPNMNTSTISYISFLNVVVTPSGPVTKCPGVGVTLQANTGSCLSYQWKRNGSNTGSNSATLNATQAGTYNVTITNIGGSSVSNSVVINDFTVTKPAITPSGTVNICMGDSVQLTSTTGRHYQWSSKTSDTLQSIYVKTAKNYTVTVTDSNNCKSTSNPTTVIIGPAVTKPAFTLTGNDTFCLGDSVVLTCNHTGYKYHWSNGDTNRSIVVKSTGNYSLFISDLYNCYSFSSDTVHIEVFPLPSKPQLKVSGNTGFCFGDSLVLSIVSPIYNYHWSDGNTDTIRFIKFSGSYFVYATDQNSCRSINSDTVNTMVYSIPQKPVISLIGTNEFCKGDSVILKSQQLMDSYEWSTGSTDSFLVVKTTGDFNLRVIDIHGCISPWSDTLKVKVHPVPPKPIISITRDTAFCDGDSVILNAPSGYAHYYWNNMETSASIIVKDSGIFRVRVFDTPLCKSEYSDSVVTLKYQKPDKPVIQLAVDQNWIKCLSNATSYKWYKRNSKQDLKILIPETVDSFQASAYCIHCYYSVVAVDNSTGCESDTSEEFEFWHVGIDQPTSGKNIKIYPIPTSKYVWIEFSELKMDESSFRIYDLNGKALLQGWVSNKQNFIDLSSLENGCYLLYLDSVKEMKLLMKE
jgi:hypothetical protein